MLMAACQTKGDRCDTSYFWWFFLRGPGFVSVYLGEREKNQLSGNLSAMMGTQSVIFQQHGHKNGNLISVWFGVCAFLLCCGF